MSRCLVPLAALLLLAQAKAHPASVQSVRVASEGSVTAVTVRADGPLPTPRVGVLPDPPRIYLDFRGVSTTTSGTSGGGSATVRGVRVAINQPEPLLTRVVLDLVAPIPHRVETAVRERGQVTILVGETVRVSPARTAASPSAAAEAPANAVGPAPATPAQPPATRAAAAAAPVIMPPTKSALALPSTSKPAQAPSVPLAPPAVPPRSASPAVPAPSAAPVQPHPAAPAPQPPATPAAPRPSAPTPSTLPPVKSPLTPPAATPPPPPPPMNDSTRARAFGEFAQKARTAGVRAPAKEIEKYLRQAAPALERLEVARPILMSLDAVAVLSLEQMGGAVEEFRAIRAMLLAINPPRSLQATHETLCSACELAGLAASTRLRAPTPEQATSAASAAAGALMLLERARAELGLLPTATRR